MARINLKKLKKLAEKELTAELNGYFGDYVEGEPVLSQSSLRSQMSGIVQHAISKNVEIVVLTLLGFEKDPYHNGKIRLLENVASPLLQHIHEQVEKLGKRLTTSWAKEGPPPAMIRRMRTAYNRCFENTLETEILDFATERGRIEGKKLARKLMNEVEFDFVEEKKNAKS